MKVLEFKSVQALEMMKYALVFSTLLPAIVWLVTCKPFSEDVARSHGNKTLIIPTTIQVEKFDGKTEQFVAKVAVSDLIYFAVGYLLTAGVPYIFCNYMLKKFGEIDEQEYKIVASQIIASLELEVLGNGGEPPKFVREKFTRKDYTNN